MQKLLLLVLAFPLFALSAQRNEVDPSAIAVPEGYAIEAVASGLTLPTTALFDGDDLIVAESGFLTTAKPRVLRIDIPSGRVEVLTERGLESPVTGLARVDGRLYISHRGKVSRLEGFGVLTDIVTGLPSSGDHHNNNLAVGSDGRVYVGQGTATNAGVVGVDNYVFGWLDKRPDVHEIPCKDLELVGTNFESENPLTEEDDTATTGAYKPFGTPAEPGEVIPGDPKCGGSIASFNPDGSDFRLVAWGLRNPFGLEFDQQGQLWATFHGADVRGSRPIFNDSDYFVRVEQDAWYGWPEYFNGLPAHDARLRAPGTPRPGFLWKHHPKLTREFVQFDSHAATNGFDFAPEAFGYPGDAFIAAFGEFTGITTGPGIELSGFSVLRLDMETKEVTTFARNDLPGPSYLNGQGGFNRPSDIEFGPDGSLYVIDWGAAKVGDTGLELSPETGTVWRIYRTDRHQPLRPDGPIVVPPAPTPEEAHEPLARNAAETYRMVLTYFWQIGLLLLILIAALVGYRRLSKD